MLFRRKVKKVQCTKSNQKQPLVRSDRCKKYLHVCNYQINTKSVPVLETFQKILTVALTKLRGDTNKRSLFTVFWVFGVLQGTPTLLVCDKCQAIFEERLSREPEKGLTDHNPGYGLNTVICRLEPKQNTLQLLRWKDFQQFLMTKSYEDFGHMNIRITLTKFVWFLFSGHL